MTTTVRKGQCACGATVYETAVMTTVEGTHVAVCAVDGRWVTVS
jgi:hypothetical protein